jgi:hypothetical protein
MVFRSSTGSLFNQSLTGSFSASVAKNRTASGRGDTGMNHMYQK